MHDRVHLADVRQEFVAQSLAVARALDEAGYVYEFDDGVGDLFGVVHFPEHFEALVGHGHHAHVGLDGAERIVLRLRARFGYCVEQCGFAYVGQTYHSEFHGRNPSVILIFFRPDQEKYFMPDSNSFMSKPKGMFL